MDDCENLNEPSLPEKEDFYSDLINGRYYRCRLCTRRKSL